MGSIRIKRSLIVIPGIMSLDHYYTDGSSIITFWKHPPNWIEKIFTSSDSNLFEFFYKADSLHLLGHSLIELSSKLGSVDLCSYFGEKTLITGLLLQLCDRSGKILILQYQLIIYPASQILDILVKSHFK